MTAIYSEKFIVFEKSVYTWECKEPIRLIKLMPEMCTNNIRHSMARGWRVWGREWRVGVESPWRVYITYDKSDVNTAKETRMDLHFFRHFSQAYDTRTLFNKLCCIMFPNIKFPCYLYENNNNIAGTHLKLLSEHPFLCNSDYLT